MNPREIPEIKEADELLREAEKTFPSHESSELFQEAFQSLNDFLQLEAPTPEIAKFVNSLKLSYARSVVSHLKDIDTKDFDKYVHYMIVLLLHMDNELKSLRTANPEIGKAFDSCKLKFKPQLDEFVSTIGRGA